MSKQGKRIAGAAAIAMLTFACVAALQAKAVGRKASGIRPGMSFAEVSRQLDGWAMINVHPLGRGTQNRAKFGPEYFGYSGDVYVLTPIEPDGRETDLRKLSRAEFELRLETLLSDGEPWTVYFNFRTIGRDTGVLVPFDGRGKSAGKPPRVATSSPHHAPFATVKARFCSASSPLNGAKLQGSVAGACYSRGARWRAIQS